jgi:hypothetical protein
LPANGFCPGRGQLLSSCSDFAGMTTKIYLNKTISAKLNPPAFWGKQTVLAKSLDEPCALHKNYPNYLFY